MDNDFDFADDDDVQTARNLKKAIAYERRVAKREFVDGLKKQSLTELVPKLPPTDTDIYIISNGSGGTYNLYQSDAVAFEFGHFVPVLIDYLGANGVTLYASTWTMNRAHALNLLQLIDDRAIASCAIVTDPYFLQRESAVANQLVEGLQLRRQRFLAFKNHVKALAIASADGKRFCSVLASANFSSQPRCENFTLSTDPGLYVFLRDSFFEAMLNNGETNQSNKRANHRARRKSV